MPETNEPLDRLFQSAVKWFVACVKVVFVVATLIACVIVILDWLYPGSFDKPIDAYFSPDAGERSQE